MTWEPDHRARVWPTDLDPRDLQPRDTVSVGNVGDAGQIDEDAEAHRAKEQADREAFPEQTVTVRARDGSQKLGLVVQRYQGGYECEELKPRHARDITLKAGDQLIVTPLQGRNAEEFLRLVKSEPAGD